MMNIIERNEFLAMNVAQLFGKAPVAVALLMELGIETDSGDTRTIAEMMGGWALQCNMSSGALIDLLHKKTALRRGEENCGISFSSIDVFAGHDKNGAAEAVSAVTLKPGDLVALVGPTGSGKSRLLGDIEWFADGDTPSGRSVRIDGKSAVHFRSAPGGHHLVAQLSQTMSFVLDTTVEGLLQLHAESRNAGTDAVKQTIDAANELSGEPFTGATPLTALSGGQTRALMVADTAILCRSPIVLIDELENAGIDRKKAFGLLVSREKIIVLSTHDPLLALLAGRRIAMRGGAMHSLITRTDAECSLLSELEAMDAVFSSVRARLRSGGELWSGLPMKGAQNEFTRRLL